VRSVIPINKLAINPSKQENLIMPKTKKIQQTYRCEVAEMDYGKLIDVPHGCENCYSIAFIFIQFNGL